jgi:uncharacterized protein with GYD domain
MPTYVALMNWTDQGVRTVGDTVHRREQADAVADKHGAKIEQVYWTVGPYDLVSILQAPDDESATAMLLELGSGREPEDHDASGLRPRRDSGIPPKTG